MNIWEDIIFYSISFFLMASSLEIVLKKVDSLCLWSFSFSEISSWNFSLLCYLFSLFCLKICEYFRECSKIYALLKSFSLAFASFILSVYSSSASSIIFHFSSIISCKNFCFFTFWYSLLPTLSVRDLSCFLCLSYYSFSSASCLCFYDSSLSLFSFEAFWISFSSLILRNKD